MNVEVEIGSMVSSFRIERLLGSGAMGTVYLARDEHLDRPVALKLLAPELARDERFRERFLRESRIAALLEHPAIVPIYAAGEAEGTLFLAMRFVDGSDLREVIRREGRLDPDRVIEIVRQVAQALDAAHEAGLVHRDVKPGNILIEGDRAYLCDFGLAKHSSTVNSLTRDSAFVGTIDYIAPEQIQGSAIDGRADEYALGCVLYELLTGQPPFRHDSDLSVVFAHLKEPPPLPSAARPELPDGIDAVIARALAKHVSQRYATCVQLVDDAAVGLAGGEVDAPPARELAHAFLIADVRGYTRYTHQHGDDAAAQLSERFIRLARHEIEEQEGRVMATHGDEVVAVFESPRRALRASLAIQSAIAADGFPLGVGVGIDAGEAVEVGDDFRGGALNMAARLCSAAGAGEVLASEPVIHLARTMAGIDYLEGRVERLKGIAQPVRVVEVVPEGAGNGVRQRLRRRMHGRRWGRVALLATALIAAGIAAVVVVTGSGSGGGHASVPGNSVAVIDAVTRRVATSYPVGTTPTDVAADGSSIWTLNDDAQTISQVDTATGQSVQRGLGVSPIQLAYGAGKLWIAYTRNVRPDHSFQVGVLELDPDTLHELGRVFLPGRIEAGAQPGHMLAALDGVLVAAAPSGRLVRVDASTHELTEGPMAQADALTPAGEAVWAVADGNTLLRIDPHTLEVVRRITVPSTAGIGTVAVGGGSVWGAEPLTGLVWRADAGSQGSGDLHTVRAGLSASDVTFGDDAAWVTSGVDGTLVRIDPRDERVTRIPIGGAPQRVAVVGGHVLVTIDGGGAAIAGGHTSDIATLPAGSCSPMVYGGDGHPDMLIASDLPLDPSDAAATQAMVQAIEYTLRSHHFRAGPYRIGFQSCDDSTVSAGSWTDGKCEANAASYVGTSSVIGVIGPYNSGCAVAALPILNAAGDQPVPVISPTNSLVGLTRTAPDTSESDVHRLYPTGVRNYLRGYPADDAQAQAVVDIARRQGVRTLAIALNDPHDGYGVGLAAFVHQSARRQGLRVLPLTLHPGSLTAEIAKIRARHADGVFLAGLPAYAGSNGLAEQLVTALHDQGLRLTVIAPDGYLPGSELIREIGKPAANGVFMTASFVNNAERLLPPAGLRWEREFRATQPGTVGFYTPYAAQATDVLLTAIARSDGTRRTVISQMFNVRVTDGILGSFGFAKDGDMTPVSIPVFRVDASRPLGAPDPVVDVIRVKPVVG